MNYKDDDMPKTNIFGIAVNTDKEMEEKAPSLDISDGNEIEEVGFNPFSNNLFDTDESRSNLRVGDEKEKKENIEIFDASMFESNEDEKK